MDERHEYETLTVIVDPGTGRPAYNPGQGIHAQVVADWGLVIGDEGDEGAQVRSLRPAEMARPAGNAGRDEWLRYRQSQPGVDQEALDEMGRDALRDMDKDQEPPAETGTATPDSED
jgi:hypothetical protein